ncbi:MULTISPECIES: sterol desaturase family protein [Flavobacterium]|uniref:Sterol desaturase family protein n=1 Tax=Flavobacterium columnare TaxID=996 RepID=A0AA94F0R9_9FLAO|nr:MULTISPECIES: sterol desaturase family protein [Flavobacterium]MCH4828792.1 sterol desaturase family protein [Flavobacterium columnare]MCH4832046.1 sterol desaturase family protein [Flavobacterium columnare]OWP86159.1 sterol desaturase [Flavobacterium covae]QYS90399.1 sterol desaturase family protein [Flavobacterium covae]
MTNEITNYFETIPSSHRSLILFGGIAFFWILESGFPRFRFEYNKIQHALLNLFFTFTTIIINFFLAILLFESCVWDSQNHFGIIHWFNISNLGLQCFIGLLLMDFIGAYVPHYLQHKIKFLWRFHLIHHTDTWLDTTSANRHHPGESIFRFLFTVLAVLITGAPVWLFFMYQSCSVLVSQFNHSNIQLPKKLNSLLSIVLVTPKIHRVHHHYQLPYTDSNYGNIFSIWDRFLRTYQNLPQDQIVFGIDTHTSFKEHNNLGNLLSIPFQKYGNSKT